MSRSFVGSSRSSTSAGSSMSRAISTRACSPPESRPTGVSSCSDAEEEALRPADDVDRAVLVDRPSRRAARACGAATRRDRAARGAGRRSRPCRPSARSIVPASGVSSPASRRSSVRLAAAVARRGGRGACPGDSDEVEVAGRSRARRSSCARSSATRAAWSAAPWPRSRCRPSTSASASRGRASSSWSRPASSMRAWDLRVRALALRESHSISPRTRLRSDSWYAPGRRAARPSSRGSRCSGPSTSRRPDGERAVELDHAAGDGLEEVAVVADGHERLGLARQQLLEPEDAVEVEVVGGLVEQQQLGLARPARARSRAASSSRPRASPSAALVGEAGLCPSRRRPGRRPRARRGARPRARRADAARRSCRRRSSGSCGT